jgi:elongation factor 1-alpha
LLGVKQLVVGVNKMDCDVAKYGQPRYDEVKNEMKEMLVKIGWKKEFIDNNVPIIPISGWIGDNLINKSTNMGWWNGVDVQSITGEKCHVNTILDVLEKQVVIPPRVKDKAMRMPVSGIYKIKGVGDVVTGRVEQGIVTPGAEVIFIPTHAPSTPCTGKIFTVEMHHKSVPQATAGDNVGLNVKGLVKENMPRVGDVMILKSDDTIGRAGNFTAQVQVLNHPGELKSGYTPVGFVRTGRSALKMTEIKWKIGKETGNKKAESPNNLKANEMAEVVFEPQQPFVVDTFKNCEGLGRVAIMEGNGVVMLGKIVAVERKAAK